MRENPTRPLGEREKRVRTPNSIHQENSPQPQKGHESHHVGDGGEDDAAGQGGIYQQFAHDQRQDSSRYSRYDQVDHQSHRDDHAERGLPEPVGGNNRHHEGP